MKMMQVPKILALVSQSAVKQKFKHSLINNGLYYSVLLDNLRSNLVSSDGLKHNDPEEFCWPTGHHEDDLRAGCPLVGPVLIA